MIKVIDVLNAKTKVTFGFKVFLYLYIDVLGKLSASGISVC